MRVDDVPSNMYQERSPRHGMQSNSTYEGS